MHSPHWIHQQHRREGDPSMKYSTTVRLLCLPAIITGILMSGPASAGDYRHDQPGYYRAAPAITGSYFGAPSQRRPRQHHSTPTIRLQSDNYRLYYSSGDSQRPGLSRSHRDGKHDISPHQRSERRYHSDDRSKQYRRQRPQSHNPHAQPGNPRAGENRLGSGNSQMRRPPQMHDPGPLQNRNPDRRYR